MLAFERGRRVGFAALIDDTTILALRTYTFLPLNRAAVLSLRFCLLERAMSIASASANGALLSTCF
jgi:hypothetical protein